MKRVIRCTKFHFSRIKGSWVIIIWMLNIWTGGGAIELVLETPKLVRSLFMTIPKSVPNFIIFPCSLHRAAIDSHGTNIIIIKHTIAIGALALWARPLIKHTRAIGALALWARPLIKHTRAIGALALWARPLNIAASSNYRGQARERPIGGGAERQEQYGRNRMYMEKTDKFRSIVVQNWTEVQMRWSKHTFLIQV